MPRSCLRTFGDACIERDLHADHTDFQNAAEITKRAALAIQFLMHHGRLAIRARNLVEGEQREAV